MLKKKQRISHARQFREILQGKPLIGKFCIIYFQTSSLLYSRLGVIASRRSLRLAVNRNKFKRVIREYFRCKLVISNSYDIVIIARKNASNASQKEIGLCLEKLFQQINPISHNE